MVPYFIAGVSVTIIPWEEFVFLIWSSQQGDFWHDFWSGFSLNINFHSYESVASYIYLLYINSVDVQFDNQSVIALQVIFSMR